MINVLIVEDENAIRRFLRTALEADGMRVFEAETLQRGLIEAATRKPDLTILDLGLPDGDGNAFIREVRQWSQMPIIVLSARTEEQDKIAALDAGADDYLSKPFGIGELQARLRVAMRRHAGARPTNRGCVLPILTLISPPAASYAAIRRSTSRRLNFACWRYCSIIPARC